VCRGRGDRNLRVGRGEEWGGLWMMVGGTDGTEGGDGDAGFAEAEGGPSGFHLLKNKCQYPFKY